MIRVVEQSDVKSVNELLNQLGYEQSVKVTKGTIANLDKRNDEIFVYQFEGDVVAVMSLIYFDYFPSSERICRITAIVVSDRVRGKGVGTELIDFAKEVADKKGCTQLEVTTSLKREKTQKYYASIGFDKSSYRYIQPLNS